MNARAGWNARYLRRRRLRLVGLALLAGLVVLLLVRGCGVLAASGDPQSPLSSGTTGSSEGSNSSGGSTESTGSGNPDDNSNDNPESREGGGFLGFGGGENTDESGDSGESEKSKKSEKPYAAIPPPEGAEPLRNIPGAGNEAEQYGNSGQYNGTDQYEEDLPAGRMLVRGAEDPSDGPLKDNRLVAYYGTPLSAAMGILGELPPEQMMKELKEQTRAYSAADPERPAIPTIELIASVAQRNPGPDGLYLQPTPEKEIRRYSKLAKKNDALLLLDVQLGRDDLMNEVKKLEPFLKQEHVHLAIDTEYSVEPGQVPGINLGTVAGSDIQRAVRYLDSLVERENIPDKLVVVHQFETGIVYGKENIKPTENVQVSLNADGFGRAAAKISKYDILVSQQPIQYGGFKVFYRQDYPILPPDKVLQLEPAPAVVNYQ